jgi:hypothetical protein
MPCEASADDLSSRRIGSGEQGRRAMAGVVMDAAFGPAWARRYVGEQADAFAA